LSFHGDKHRGRIEALRSVAGTRTLARVSTVINTVAELKRDPVADAAADEAVSTVINTVAELKPEFRPPFPIGVFEVSTVINTVAELKPRIAPKQAFA